jgi:predicted nucleic acid-binding protein
MNATGSVLLDTSVVIDYLRQQDQSLIRQMEGTHELYLPLGRGDSFTHLRL